jgi:hypothetical protein
LGASRYLRDFSGRKDFLRGLISLEDNAAAIKGEQGSSPGGGQDSSQGSGECGEEERLDHLNQQLEQILAAVVRVFRVARGNARPAVMPWNALFEVNRTSATQARSTPFHYQFKRRTRQRYMRVHI